MNADTTPRTPGLEERIAQVLHEERCGYLPWDQLPENKRNAWLAVAVALLGAAPSGEPELREQIADLERQLHIALETIRAGAAPAERGDSDRFLWLMRHLPGSTARRMGVVWEDGSSAESLRRAVDSAMLAAAPREQEPEDDDFDEDTAIMACGHEGRQWSSEWKRCMVCGFRPSTEEPPAPGETTAAPAWMVERNRRNTTNAADRAFEGRDYIAAPGETRCTVCRNTPLPCMGGHAGAAPDSEAARLADARKTLLAAWSDGETPWDRLQKLETVLTPDQVHASPEVEDAAARLLRGRGGEGEA